jgi:DUF971 family protein
MSGAVPGPLVPLAIRREGDGLLIEWSDGVRCTYGWQQLRDNCPCATCREERDKPPDPFRVLKPNELQPLQAVAMPRVGNYGYKIVWSDGHDTGIYTLLQLRSLCQGTPGPAGTTNAPGA